MNTQWEKIVYSIGKKSLHDLPKERECQRCNKYGISASIAQRSIMNALQLVETTLQLGKATDNDQKTLLSSEIDNILQKISNDKKLGIKYDSNIL